MTTRQTRKQIEVLEKKSLETCVKDGESQNGQTFYVTPFLPEKFLEWRSLRVYLKMTFHAAWTSKQISTLRLADAATNYTISTLITGPWQASGGVLEVTFNLDSYVKQASFIDLRTLFLIFDTGLGSQANFSTVNSLTLDMAYLVEEQRK